MPKIENCYKCDRLIFFMRKFKGGAWVPVDAEEIEIMDYYGEVVKGHRMHWDTCPAKKEYERLNTKS
ncbi:MAG: hypothetical protein WCW77_00620 [Patescibacteria group bacterium]|jgi:hypothetical protein